MERDGGPPFAASRDRLTRAIRGPLNSCHPSIRARPEVPSSRVQLMRPGPVGVIVKQEV